MSEAPHPPTRLRFSLERTPELGELLTVVPGIRWARLPLPFRLNHVNVWILQEPDGFSIVDCGVDTLEMRSLWETMLSGPLAGSVARRLIATHGHTDHVGLAGHLVEKLEIPFHATLIEWMASRIRFLARLEPQDETLSAFWFAHGCAAEMAEGFATERSRISGYLGRLPPSLERLRDNGIYVFGGRAWQVIVAGGHADEHASLYCKADGILIAGDQILPNISPVIGVHPDQPQADPLTEYLDSLARFKTLPADTLVLPSHGAPFRGLHERIDELVLHHHERLDRLEQQLVEPITAAQAAKALFAKATREGHGRLALAETLAHLHRLVTVGRAQKYIEAAGHILFVATLGKTFD
jgi:glyoxylase-like metal-dependent hydrolase (beta-lactamase superfamily II)